jgi:hypothetical protein
MIYSPAQAMYKQSFFVILLDFISKPMWLCVKKTNRDIETQADY